VAPLSSAALATGVVIVEGQRKQVQHLEGGIVKEILIRDGDAVDAGQIIMRLDETHALASRDLLLGQLRAARALEARLIAERDTNEEIAFPQDLLDQQNEPRVAEILTTQTNLFKARLKAFVGELKVLEQRIAQAKKEIAGLEAQRKSERRQLQLIAEEIKGVEAMLAKGLERKPRLLALQRAAAQLEGNLGSHSAQIARAEATITESQLRMIDLNNQRLKEIASQLTEAQSLISENQEKLRAVEDTLKRVDIRAPAAGIVVGLKVFTVGGVIAPGQVVAEIVPQKETLVIEAKIRPEDIDVVHPGLPAQVHLQSLDARMPSLEGTVTQVAADRLTDPQTQTPYYGAIITINPESLEETIGAVLYPGMPASVTIATGRRTVLNYIVSPVTDYMSRAMREN
jgi:HlyD family type I secretion membrane fusion protein